MSEPGWITAWPAHCRSLAERCMGRRTAAHAWPGSAASRFGIGCARRRRSRGHGCRRRHRARRCHGRRRPCTSVSMPSPIASTSPHSTVAAQRVARAPQRRLVDRAMRLAGNQRAAAELRIVAGERAGAPDQAVAALDDDVGIGADERKVARPQPLQHRVRSLPASRSRRRKARCRRRRRPRTPRRVSTSSPS